ncbi:mitogen-activated protein kinase kinase kinase, partial [Sarracenia purpurea var. burkii]
DLDLKKLQTPLYVEFYNSLNAAGSPSAIRIENKENMTNNLRLPSKRRSPKQLSSRILSAAVDVAYTSSSETRSHCVSDMKVIKLCRKYSQQSLVNGKSFLLMLQRS